MLTLSTRLVRALAASLLLLVLGGAAVAIAAPGDIGHRDGSYSGASGSPSGSKPESKVWFNDGIWWASEWSNSPAGFYIHKLNTSTETFVSTGTLIDNRPASRQDTLWDGTHLYVGSQNFSEGGSLTGGVTRIYRFSYNTNTDTYSLDNGFPATMRGTVRSETFVIAKDSTGTLWATWTQPSGGNKIVYTSHTQNGNDASWTSPAILPVGNQGVGVTTDPDDISTIVSFSVSGQGRIGVFWSNHTDDKFYFAWHVDGASDTAWTAETAWGGPSFADDHMNLKADANGKIYAVVKTSINGSGQPLIELLVRQPGGGWTPYLVANGSNCCTRPIVELDESAGVIHVFQTGPSNSGCGGATTGSGQSGGSIYEKTSSTSSISFSTSQGTPIMCDATDSSTSHDMNNPSSTKQNINSSTGVVVIATNDTSDTYFHAHLTLGGGGGPQAPVANFTANATTGNPGLNVAFTDTSSNTPTSWAWNFGDPASGGANTSTLQNPSHVYNTAGTYTVSLTATNGQGSDPEVKTNYITVTSGGGGGQPVTLTPDADAQIKVGSTAVQSDTTHLRTREEVPLSTNSYRSFIRFNIPPINGTVSNVKLRVYVTTSSNSTLSVRNTTGNPNWTESTANGSNTPTVGSTVFGSAPSTPAGAYIDIPLNGSPITGTGLTTFALTGSNTSSAYFASKELTSPVAPPQLVYTVTQAGTAPTAIATSATVGEDASGPVGLSGTDPELCDLTFSIVTPPAHGALGAIDPLPCASGIPNSDTASVTYTPAANYSGPDTFTYKVNDGTADSPAATATLTVTPVDDPPTANAGSASTPQSTPKVLTLTGSDVDTCDLTFNVTVQPTNGTLSATTDQSCVNGTNPKTDSLQITYTPTGSYNGPDSFQFTVADAGTTSAAAAFNLTVTPPNSLPTANDTSANTNEDNAVSVGLSGGDVETCELTFAILTGPTHGSLGTITSPGSNCAGSGPFTDSASVTYTPASNYFGADSFTYKVTDGASGDSTTATATLGITSQNDLPTAGNVNTSAVIGTPKAITLTGGDVESCDLTFTLLTQPTNGSLAGGGTITPKTCAGTGPYTDSAEVTYTATSGTSDSFTYKTTDTDSGNSTTATVTISISGGTPVSTTVPVLMDAQVQSGSVNGNYGTLTPFRTREGADPIYRLYFKFQVPTLSGTITSAKLRLYVTTASSSLQTAYAVADTSWIESGVGGITWATAPAIGAAGPSAIAAGPVNTYIEIPVSPSAINSGALTSLAVKGSNTTSAYFNSRESATNRPELVIVTGP